MKKIKRYKKIYRSRSRGGSRMTPVKTVLLVVICAAFLFVGFSVVGPLVDFFRGNIQPSVEPGPSPAAVGQTDAPDGTGSPEPTPTPTPEPTPTPPAQLSAAWISHSVFRDAAQLSAVADELAAKGIQSVVVEVKDRNGLLYFPSAHAPAGEVLAPSATDPSASLALLAEKGMYAYASMYVFEDNSAAKHMPDNSVRYRGNPQWFWVDDSVERGGRRWLNPYDAEARQYNVNLANELAGLGFEGVVMRSVSFPTGYALDLAYYGEQETTVPRTQALSEYVALAQAQASEKGYDLLFMGSVADLTEENAMKYGGTLSAIGCDSLLVDLRAVQADAAALKAAADSVRAQASGRRLVAFVQNDAVQNIQTITTARNALAIEECIYYNESGKYE